MIIETQYFSNPNNVIKFNDNSRFVILLIVKYLIDDYLLIHFYSAINGFKVKQIKPSKSFEPSFYISESYNFNLVFTAETHNFPTGVEPFRYFI
jgi:phosphoribosylformylglycinamidine synthase